jgi:hypothetical protein
MIGARDIAFPRLDALPMRCLTRRALAVSSTAKKFGGNAFVLKTIRMMRTMGPDSYRYTSLN